MSKKSVFALMLIVMFSIMLVTPIVFTNVANANFVFPPSNPDIIFNSPVNTTYTTNNVSLNVTVATYLTGWYGGPRDKSLTWLEYSIDGSKFQPLNITNSITEGNPGNTAQFNCSISLYQLSEGNHTLTVKAVLDYYTYNYPQPGENFLHTESTSNAYIIINSVLYSPDSDTMGNSGISIPQLIIVFALTAAVVVSLLVYYLRIKS